MTENKPITVYTADCIGNAVNCRYPNEVNITDEITAKSAFSKDMVCAKYKNGHRSVLNFETANALPMDCDNDHSDIPADWITPEDVAEFFADVPYVLHFSRHHEKPKGGKGPRPRFHIVFRIDPEQDVDRYTALKKRLLAVFPFFDANATDAARFLFGTENPKVIYHPGTISLNAFLDDRENEQAFADLGHTIPEGSRNATLSHYAGRILKRFGNTDEAHKHFAEVAACCQPPLEQSELDSIWRSAQRFYEKVSTQEGYIPPEQYNQDLQLKPTDYSDVGQATVLAREYEGKLRYSPSTDFLVYNGRFWEESKPKAQAVAQELTTRQLEEAETEIKKATDEMMKNGAWELLASMGPKKAAMAFSSEQARSFQKYENATTYRNYAIKRRDSKYITAALKEAHPMVEIDQRQLDADEFLEYAIVHGNYYGTSKLSVLDQILMPFVLAFLPLMSTLLRISSPSRPRLTRPMKVWISGRTLWRPSSAATTSSSIMFRRSLVFPLSGRSVSRV